MRLPLLVLAFLSLTVSFALLATGGFQTTVLGLRASARSPAAAGVVAALAAIAWLLLARRPEAVASDLTFLANWIERRARVMVLTIAVVSAAVAIRFGTFSAAGSDPSGYLSQAAMLADGALTRDEPLARLARWPEAASTLAPLGWWATVGTTEVPTYAVGLPLLMAIPHTIAGAVGASLVVSASAALAVWLAGRLAMLFAGGAAGLIAAIGLATMPVFLFESIQPMSDVPVTAAWLGVWYTIRSGSAVGAGMAAALAVLVRPNLAPLAAVPALYLLAGLMGKAGLKPRPPRRVIVACVLFTALAGAFVAYLQWRYFGSPFRSGYGSAAEIYALANVTPNAWLYLKWLLQTHGWWLLLAPAVLFVCRDPLMRWMLGFAVLVCGGYFLYSIFEHWSYLRFLLPAMAIAGIAVAVLAVALAGRLPAPAQTPVLIVMTLALAALQVSVARELDVFRWAARQSRALLAGRYLASALPANAVVIAGEQSGSIRYYSGRPIVRWDFLKPSDLPFVTNELTAGGYELWVALDDWEVPRYREKFPRSVAAGLDWPPILDAGSEGRTQAWRLRDRANFVNGADIATDRLR